MNLKKLNTSSREDMISMLFIEFVDNFIKAVNLDLLNDNEKLDVSCYGNLEKSEFIVNIKKENKDETVN